jgi:pectate lyase
MVALLVVFSIAVSAPANDARAAAFPGAEGYGAEATGGRGGSVIHVTTLDPAGPGSLQAALSASGPRIIVFDVSGVITADEIRITQGDFTLAGETAPGGGITLNARLVSTYRDTAVTNFIIRHIRVRPTDLSGEQGDAIQIASNSNFILDHVTASWGSDETVDLYESHDFTVQWSTIEASATHAGHPDGDFHNYGLINGPDGYNASIHHNLFAHHNQRSPAVANGMSAIVNNVVYNFWRGFNHHNPADTQGFNFIGNYYKPGPDADDPIAILIDDEDETSGPYYYMADLCYGGAPTPNPWEIVAHWPTTMSPVPSQADAPFATPAVTTHSCEEAYNQVLDQAGAWPRDTITLATISEVKSGTGSWGRVVPADLMAGLTPTTAPADSDGDGMPDDWEAARGLDPDFADDAGDDDGDGYTNIEAYLQYRADLLVDGGATDPADTTPPTPPGELTARAVSATRIDLSWSAANDDVAVSGYRIYRDGQAVATTTALSYTDTGLAPATTYAYALAAYDGAGNESGLCPAVAAVTPEDSGDDGAGGDAGGGDAGGGSGDNNNGDEDGGGAGESGFCFLRTLHIF